MKRKILTTVLVTIMMIFTLTNAYAEETFFNLGAFETAYKLSNEADIDLPFVNIFSKAATYDKVVKHSGISIGQSIIDIDEKLEGVHFVMSTDMINIKGEVEHGLIYGTNIVIEGKISKDTVLIAENVKILESAEIERDLIVVANKLDIAGKVKGNLIGEVLQTTITGTVEQDLRLDLIKLDLNGGTINGTIYLTVPENGVSNVTGVTEKYPNAVIKEKIQNTDEESVNKDIGNDILNGIKVVLIYSVVGILLAKKEKGFVDKATNRFIQNSSFGIITGVAMWMLILPVSLLLILLAFMGFGIISWPVLIMYICLLLLSMSISTFVVGITLYEALKSKLGKFKIPVLVGIFALIYTLTQITSISFYVAIIVNIMSTGIIMSYIFKREEYRTEDTVEAKILDDKKDNK